MALDRPCRLDYVPVVPTVTVARLSLMAITALAYGVRIWRLDGHAYRGDEAFVVWFVRQDWSNLVAAIRQNEPHPPLYYLLTKVWSGLFGDSEVVFRFFPPLVFGVIAIPLLGAIAWQLLPGPRGRLVGLAGALFLALNPFHLWYSQDARMYTQATGLTLASTFCLIVLAAKPAITRRWVWYGLLTSMAILTHYAAIPLVLVQNAVVLAGRPLLDPRRWLALQVGVMALPAVWIAGNAGLLGRYVGNGDSPGLADAVRRTATTFVVGRSLLPEWATVAGLGSLVLAALGFAAILRVGPNRRLAALTGLGVLAGFTVQWIASLRGPVFSDTYLLPAGGTYFLLWSGVLLIGSRWAASVAAFALGGLLLANGVAVQAYWFDPASAKGADWRSAAATIVRDSRPGDAIVLNYPDPTFEYYYRGTIPVRLLPATVPFRDSEIGSELTSLSESSKRIWLVPVRAANWDANGLVERWLNEHATALGSASFHQVRVVLYETTTGLVERATPIDARFGGEITLRGAAITLSRSCRLPCPVSVDLIWSTIRQPAADYKVFIHLLDSSGRLVGQSDGVPAEWRRPTTGWSAGELIVDPHEIAITVSGRYRLIAGLYQSDGRRLITERGQDSIEIGSVVVD